ncbi:FAD-dependent oxidoreductase [Nocardioides sp. AE5]|uniref:FAD-dependent oxidoreductase n=1 Tax=Nocardioides sp. AE5 TaxID=2962573 RepID=UPI0028824626|nr:FAD-dependent oxidoreductase [Nocardioides sp. AE5]MDT0203146.1 FAD-dependent oxidoreductase [Nocardioides sp. AE5]
MTWDATYDVVVVGSGAGAMTGAYLAARAGLSVAVVEKTDKLGGTTAYSGAAAWLPGTQVQERAGLPDSTESARTYLNALLDEPDQAKLEAFLAEAPRLVAQLEEDPLLSFEFQAFPDYFERPGRVPGGRSFVPTPLPLEEIGERRDLVRPPVDRERVGKGHHLGQPLAAGRAYIGRFLMALDATGNATVHTRTAVDELLTEDDRVVGVAGTDGNGNRVTYGARRGVLLAAGGFERNHDERARHGVPGNAAWTMAPEESNTGEPIAAAVALGAATDLMDQAWFTPGIAHPDGSAAFTLGFRGGLVVDQNGQRYANESLPYDQMGRAMAADAARIPSYVVFDSTSMGHLPAIAIPEGNPEDHLAAGTWHRADTLVDLAAAIGVPADALVATVERFNGFAAAGDDEDFDRGKDEFASYFASPVLVTVAEGPFWAARLVLSDLGTKGGLVTDVDARVLRGDGSPIEGLYAAGNTSASMTGKFYPGPGAPIGTAMAFASRAVRHLAAT